MTRYFLTPAAQADLSDIWDFTSERWGQDQAERYVLQIRTAASDLAHGRKPSRSAADIRSDYRKCLVGSHVVYFRDANDGIAIIRILHQSMDPNAHLDS